MTTLVGARVVRGPGWQGEDDDGGDGQLGTIVGSEKGSIKVDIKWDNGNLSRCDIENTVEPEILLYDNGPAGVSHPDISCNTCANGEAADITGIRWQCMVCDGINLCTQCYMTDKHDVTHQFLCIPLPELAEGEGLVMEKREQAEKLQVFGIHPGTTVSKDGIEGIIRNSLGWNDTAFCTTFNVQWPSGKEEFQIGSEEYMKLQGHRCGQGECYKLHLPPVGFLTLREGHAEYHQGNDFVESEDPGIRRYLQKSDSTCCVRRICRNCGRMCLAVQPVELVNDTDSEHTNVSNIMTNTNTDGRLPEYLQPEQLNDKFLRKLVKHIPADKIGELATNLGLTNVELSFIISDYNTTSERIFQVLLKWRNRWKGMNILAHLESVFAQMEVPFSAVFFIPDSGYPQPFTTYPYANGMTQYAYGMYDSQPRTLDTNCKYVLAPKQPMMIEGRVPNDTGPKTDRLPTAKRQDRPDGNFESQAFQKEISLERSESLTEKEEKVIESQPEEKEPPKADKPADNSTPPKDSSRPFKKGDHVKIKDISPEEMKRLQDGHGGFVKLMGLSGNSFGVIKAIDSDGDVRVKTEAGFSWTYNPECLRMANAGEYTPNRKSRTAAGFKKGDHVRIKDIPVAEIQRLQQGHGGYNPLMGMTRNRRGKVKRIDSDGDVRVQMEDGPSWAFNPQCLIPLNSKEEQDERSGGLFQKGDGVQVKEDVSIEEMKELQEDSGGWVPRLVEERGKLARVSQVTLSRVIVKMHSGETWAFHPLLLVPDEKAATPVPMERHLRKGDKVRVIDMSAETMQKLQEGHGGWISDMAKTINKTGTIVQNLKGRMFKVEFESSKRFTYNKKCLTLEEPVPGHEESTWSDESDADSSDDDSSDDEIAEGLAKELLKPLVQRVLRNHSEELGKNEKSNVITKGPIALLDAVKGGDKEKTATIIALRPDWVNYLSEDGNRTPLFDACHYGYPAIVKMLVDAGASIELANATQGIRPLMVAAHEDRSEILKYLLSKGADVNAVSNNGVTACHFAISRKNDDCVKVLLRAQNNCDVSIRDSNDVSIAEKAILSSSSDTLALVLSSPTFDASQPDKRGFNCLHVATGHGKTKAVETILRKWPEGTKSKTNDGWTPVHLAADRNHVDTLRAVLDQGTCDIDARGDRGQTSLHRAVAHGHIESVELLIERGADVNAQDSDGDTILHLACMLMSRETGMLSSTLLSQLLQGEVSDNSEDTDNHKTIAVCLVQSGAKVDILNHKGLSPLNLLTDKSLKETLIDITLSRAADVAKEGGDKVVHPFITCDICFMQPIVGPRYKCVVCKDFDLCQKCVNKKSHPDHGFVLIPTPKSKKRESGDHDIKDEQGPTVETPDNEFFPKTDYVSFNSSVKISKIVDKLKEFNSGLQESCRRSESDLALIEHLLYATSGNTSVAPTSQQIDVLKEILLKWPTDKLVPALDVLRLAIRDPNVNRHLCSADSGEKFGAHVIQRAVESKNPANQYMVCRAFCNIFQHEDGFQFLLNDKTRDNIIEAVMDFSDIKIGAYPANNAAKNLRITAATLLLNFAVAFHIHGHNSSDKWRCVNAVAQMLEKENDPETNFRLLQGLGTLMAGDDYAVAIARSKDLLGQMTRFLGVAGEKEKVGYCASYVAQMLRC